MECSLLQIMKSLFSAVTYILFFVFVSFSQITEKGSKQTQNVKLKQNSVFRLVTNTSDIFSKEVFESAFDTVIKEEGLNQTIEEDLPRIILSKIEENNKISLAKKNELKTKFYNEKTKLSQRILKSFIERIFNDFIPLDDFIKETLNKIYFQDFTIGELQILNKYFVTVDGKNLKKVLNEMMLAVARKEDITNYNQKLVGLLFIKEPLGTKFIKAITGGVGKEWLKKTNDLSNTLNFQIVKKYYDNALYEVVDEFTVNINY